LAHLLPSFGLVIESLKLDSKWIPRKEEMVAREDLEKMLEMNALGENETHTW
jgi:hypothetical protein